MTVRLVLPTSKEWVQQSQDGGFYLWNALAQKVYEPTGQPVPYLDCAGPFPTAELAWDSRFFE